MLQVLRRAERSRCFATLLDSASRAQSSLAYEEVSASPKNGSADGEPMQAAIVHGLLGQGRNWRTWGRRLAKEAAEATHRSWSILLLDQRCHGASTWVEGFNPPHTLGSSATDIAQLFRRTFSKGPDMLIGHSLGGKVALEYLSSGGTGLTLPRQVWVLDTNPGLLPKDKSDVAKVMDMIGDIKVPLPSRDMATAKLGDHGFSEALRLWLGSNLINAPGGGGLTWTFNLDGARQMYDDYKGTEFWQLMGEVPPGVALHIVRAANSDRWTMALEEKLHAAVEAAEAGAGTDQKGVLEVHTLQNAGHWLHVDNPDGLLQMVLQGCKQAAKDKSETAGQG